MPQSLKQLATQRTWKQIFAGFVVAILLLPVPVYAITFTSGTWTPSQPAIDDGFSLATGNGQPGLVYFLTGPANGDFQGNGTFTYSFTNIISGANTEQFVATFSNFNAYSFGDNSSLQVELSFGDVNPSSVTFDDTMFASSIRSDDLELANTPFVLSGTSTEVTLTITFINSGGEPHNSWTNSSTQTIVFGPP